MSISEGQVVSHFCAPWTAPEVFQRTKPNERTDVYSFGMVLWEMSIADQWHRPFEGMSPKIIRERLLKGQREKIPLGTPKAIRTLIESCWSEDPNNRPTVDEISVQLRTYQRHILKKTFPETWHLPALAENFSPRLDLLNKMNRAFDERQADGVPIVALAGPGGMGKTQLAVDYARRGRYLITAWFTADISAQLEMSFAEFAEACHLPVTIKDGREAVQTAMKNFLEKNPGWLLIFDNVEQLSEIASYLPSNGGKILITTRTLDWPPSVQTVEVSKMTEDEAIDLLSQ